MRKDTKILFGLDRFFEEAIFKKYLGKNVALLCNQASIDHRFIPAYFLFKEYFGKRFKFIFSPQHGLYSEKQANMIGSEDWIEPFTQVPVISLYGPRLKPESQHLSEVDIVFVDLQEVGCRVYTYIWTLYLLMDSCEKEEKTLVILDRPNPIGSEVEGPILEKEFFSFVGMDSLPLRHGLTLGELANLFKKRHFKDLSLEIVKIEGYKREYLFCDLKRNWVFPSPNIPTWETALVYPGQVILEGTNLSEGRGTALPFFIFGAPFFEIKKTKNTFDKIFNYEKEGFFLRPIVFEPWADKWRSQKCYGFQLHITDFKRFKPIKTSLIILKTIIDIHENFRFLKGPYEFEEEKRPIEILIGNKAVIDWLEGKAEIDLNQYLYYNLESYLEEIKTVLLYA